VTRLSPTIKLLLAAVVVLIVAAVTASTITRHKLMQAAAGASAAQVEIARLMPDLQGRKRREAIRGIDRIVRRNANDDLALRSAMAAYASAGLDEEAARVGELYLASSDSGGLRPKPSLEEVAEIASATGMAYSEMGDHARALQLTERALDAFPDNPTYLNNLGYFLAEQGNELPRALELTSRAVELSPGNASFLDSYGWALYMSGKYTQALEPMIKATELEPNSAEIRYHLGAVYLKLGRIEEARIEIRKSLFIEDTPQARRLLKSIERRGTGF